MIKIQSVFLFLILYLSSDTNIKSKYLQEELKGTVLYNKNRTKKKRKKERQYKNKH